MATVQRFEDLTFWQKARELTREIYAAFKGCTDRGFTDQIQRAAVSIVSNVAEGFESGTRQEFLNYLYIAKASAGEVRAQLYVALDVGYLQPENFKTLKFKAEEVSKLLSAFIKGVKSSRYEGLQRRGELTKQQRDEQAFFKEVEERLAAIRRAKEGKGENV